MQKIYERINWENEPSTNTAISEDNLNKMDYALDKIDDRVVQLSGYQDRVAESEKNAKQSEINAKESEINAKDSELKAKEYKEQAFSGTPDGYEALVNQVGLLDIATSTGNTLYNSKPGGYRLQELVGNTEQKTLSGKNLLNCIGITKTMNGVTFTNNGNGTYTVNGTATADTFFELAPTFTDLPLDKAYRLVGCPSGGNLQKYMLYDDENNTQTARDFGNGVTYTATNQPQIYIKIVSGTVCNNLLFKPMLVDATLYPDVTYDDYEEYCGNTPSPNPEYKQAIKRTFDCVEMIRGYYKQADGTYATSSEFLCSKHKIPCKEGDVIKLDLEDVTPLFRIVYYNGDTFLSYVELVNSNSITKTVPTNATHFTVTFRGFTLETVGKITLTVNGKYVGQIVENGKNLFNKGLFTNSSSWAYKDIKFKPNTTYTVSCSIPTNISTTVAFFAMKSGVSADENKNRVTVETPRTFTTNDDGIVRFQWKVTDTTNYNILNYNFQIEEGEVVTEFEEYTEKVTTFFLNEPLRATDRVVRKDGVIYENHKRTTVVFDGSDDEGIENKTSEYTNKTENQRRFRLSVPLYFGGNNTANIISNIGYNGRISVDAYSKIGLNSVGISSTTTYEGMFITTDNVEITDLTTFKTWLASNPIEIEYDLAEETYTPLDTESQIALNDMVTFDTITYIEVDSKVKHTSISGEYGTSKVGALALENANLHDTVNFTTVKGSVANNLTTTEEGFVLDARQGTYIDNRLLSLESLTLQYLNEPTLSNYTEPMRAIVENATDAPINDEFNNTALFEVETVQDSFGRTILMQRYTTLSQYAQAVKVRFSTYDTNWTLSDWIDS